MQIWEEWGVCKNLEIAKIPPIDQFLFFEEKSFPSVSR
jgi:hypothetical protein